MRTIIIDTSVLIHDPNAVDNYKGERVAIPIYVVMELDDLKDAKKGEVSQLARKASNKILTYLNEGSFEGVLEVVGLTESDLGVDTLDRSFMDTNRKMDTLILQSAIGQKRAGHDVVLLTKDTNLRILAISEGLLAEDYDIDHVSMSDIWKGSQSVNVESLDVSVFGDIKESYWSNTHIDIDRVEGALSRAPLENEFIIFEDNGANKTHLFRYAQGRCNLVDKKESFCNIKPRNLEQTMALNLLGRPDIELCCIIGKAGTGKTILALGSALAQLSSTYDRIILTKPVVDVGKGIGFLPGGLGEKLEPWMQSFFDNLDQLLPPTGGDKAKGAHKAESTWLPLLESGVIEIQPINTIRGRSLSRAYMIVDEAQNLTKHEVKSIITRAAEGTKVVLMGDPHQVDNPYLDKNNNGLVYVVERMKNQACFGATLLHRSERSSLSDLAADLL
jgi:PhoH-like ATPase